MGLLTKIFGSPEGGSEAAGGRTPDAAATPQNEGSGAERWEPAKGEQGSSGIRASSEAPPVGPHEANRAAATKRRPEHPRMYLRPTNAVVDPAIPGTTRKPQIAVRQTGKEIAGVRAGAASARAPSGKSHSERSEGARPARGDTASAATSKGSSVTDGPSTRRGLPPDLPSSASIRTPPDGARAKPAMVVSPVSLTAEELRLPAGARPKMPTLLGLGAAFDTPYPPGVALSPSLDPSSKVPSVAPSLSNSAIARSLAGSSVQRAVAAALVGTNLDPGSAPLDEPMEPAAFDGPSTPLLSGPPEDLAPSVQLLADFALKLSIGPVSKLWVPDVRRAAEALRIAGKHRQEVALSAAASHLLELLDGEALDGEGQTDRFVDAGSDGLGDTPGLEAGDAHRTTEPSPSSRSAPTGYAAPIDGDTRDGILHVVSGLAGLLPEWPAPAQDLAEEARRREQRIVRELFTVVDGLNRDQRCRLEEQMRFEELGLSTPEALSDEFEAPIERTRELSLVFQAYRMERQARAPDVGNAIGLSRAMDELEKRAREFEDCDEEQGKEQRLARRRRRQALTRVNLLLAERGELEWLDVLEPLSVTERVEQLRQLLSAAPEGLS